MDNNIVVAGIQLLCNAPKAEMLKKAENQIEKLMKYNRDIDVLVLPEHFYQIKSISKSFNEEFGEKFDGLFEIWAKNIAKKYNLNLIAGTFPRRPANTEVTVEDCRKNKVFNTCLVINRNGERVGFYDKIHLFDAYSVKESDDFVAGNELGIFDLDIGKIGLWICYDTRFPEIARALRQYDVDLFVVPAAFYKPNENHWDVLLKAAAIANQTPLIGVNQAGDLPDGKGFFGKSIIVDANGEYINKMDGTEGFFTGEINTELTHQLRCKNPIMENKREDLYKSWF